MNIVVSLDKKPGITSHDAVSAVKKIFKVRKAGHTGTLDPIAGGLLLVCLNEATKVAGLIEAFDKEYIASAVLGEATDTYDSEGRMLRSADASEVTGDDVRKALAGFIGEIEQTPPMYSAIKVCGQPLYKLARRGIEIERKPRRIFVKSIDIIEFASPVLKLRIACSKGVYIRSIINDLGDTLGVGAHMTGLLRTKIGFFRIEDSATLEQLPDSPNSLFSIDDAIAHIPELRLSDDDTKKAKNGRPLSRTSIVGESCEPGSVIRLKDAEGRLFGIGKVMRDSIKIERLLLL
jgi:tRNA pseudouridine55 synthase